MTEPNPRRSRRGLPNPTVSFPGAGAGVVHDAGQGLLWVGDPHLSVKAPVRRRDEAWAETVLGKLRFAVAQANARNLQAICPGDLFDAPDEDDMVLLYRTIEILRGLRRRMLVVPGNHDKGELALTAADPLAVLGIAGVVTLVSDPSLHGVLEFTHPDGRRRRILMGCTAYGYKEPASLAEALGLPDGTDSATALAGAGVEEAWWITHADYAFESAYPGAAPLHEIPGIARVFNGHMHKPQKPARRGETAWFCPGNIVRMSIDTAFLAPRVWIIDPFSTETVEADGGCVPALSPIDIPHVSGSDAFSFEGHHAEAAQTVEVPFDSSFAHTLLSMREAGRGDAPRWLDEVESVVETLNPNPQVRAIVARLARDAWKKTPAP